MIYQVHDRPTKNSTEAPNLGKLQCRHPFHSAYACGGICVGMDPVYRARYIHSFAYPLQHPNFSVEISARQVHRSTSGSLLQPCWGTGRFMSGMSVVVARLCSYAHCFSEFEARQLHQEMAAKFSVTWASLFFSTLYHYSFKSLCGPKGQTNSNRFLAGMHSVDIAKYPLPQGMSNNMRQHSLKQHLFV